MQRAAKVSCEGGALDCAASDAFWRRVAYWRRHSVQMDKQAQSWTIDLVKETCYAGRTIIDGWRRAIRGWSLTQPPEIREGATGRRECTTVDLARASVASVLRLSCLIDRGAVTVAGNAGMWKLEVGMKWRSRRGNGVAVEWRVTSTKA